MEKGETRENEEVESTIEMTVENASKQEKYIQELKKIKWVKVRVTGGI